MKKDIKAFQQKATQTILANAKLELQVYESDIRTLFTHGIQQICELIVIKESPNIADCAFYAKLVLVDALNNQPEVLCYVCFQDEASAINNQTAVDTLIRLFADLYPNDGEMFDRRFVLTDMEKAAIEIYREAAVAMIDSVFHKSWKTVLAVYCSHDCKLAMKKFIQEELEGMPPKMLQLRRMLNLPLTCTP